MKERQPTLSPQDQALIGVIARESAPAPMSPRRQAAFRQALNERLERRRQMWWGAVVAAAAATAAAVLLVVNTPAPDRSLTVASAVEEPSLYAYVDPEIYSTDSLREYLPGEYRVIADVVDGPVE